LASCLHLLFLLTIPDVPSKNCTNDIQHNVQRHRYSTWI
jgi:hypothetical protein